ncbi:hypothetical protein Q3G72_019151 [Acer saccharum]|nr:hypothetical protein Q3G72_019151 [Acer saccharum]
MEKHFQAILSTSFYAEFSHTWAYYDLGQQKQSNSNWNGRNDALTSIINLKITATHSKLKSKSGSNYNPEAVKNFFKHILAVVPKEETKSHISYVIPHDRQGFLTELQDRQVSLTTSEDVFLNIVKKAQLELQCLKSLFAAASTGRARSSIFDIVSIISPKNVVGILEDCMGLLSNCSGLSEYVERQAEVRSAHKLFVSCNAFNGMFEALTKLQKIDMMLGSLPDIYPQIEKEIEEQSREDDRTMLESSRALLEPVWMYHVYETERFSMMEEEMESL